MDEEERMCRYCFDGDEDGELISPCKCSGGQQFVHLRCLRQWQRMVLVSQPTHPAFYDRDLRHQTCNVCKAEFTCAPPTRHELMSSFTGPEIAALIDKGCIIAAHQVFSVELERRLEEQPAFLRERSGYSHWIRGVYLITAVEVDDGSVALRVDSRSMLTSLRQRLGETLSMSMQGRRLRLAALGSLEGVSPEDLTKAFAALEVPCMVHLEPEEPQNCGDDHVVAVNLTRPIERVPQPEVVQQAVANVCAKYRSAAHVEITHFIGGPCEMEDLMCCIVPGGGGPGWTVVKDLERAVELAHSRAAKRCESQGDVRGGQTVRLTGLRQSPELNGEVGLALRFAEDSGRWLVRLRSGEGKQLRPVNLEGLGGAHGRVFAAWGDARWSRAQLLGEIARGHWGLCRACVSDISAAPPERRATVDDRLIFAPVTDMTESFMQEGQRQMVLARATMQMHNLPEPEDEEG
mmetsp:Transcript_44422/g.96563  ORF Transcript_44422/g.96563 Transcript_44422/m.96563 type:complete len:462 (-) Transcript_44422:272-1657(-)